MDKAARSDGDTKADELLVGREDGAVILTLNRPERLNALTLPLLQSLDRAVKAAVVDPSCRVIMVTGSGRGFCAGQDLTAFTGMETQANPVGAALDEGYNPLIRSLRGAAKPILAAVNGVAAGAGANLALCCDWVVAKRSSYFVQPFCNLGLIPDAGGSWLLPRLIGEARAKRLAFSGEKLSAEQACDWGLIAEVVDDDDFDAHCGRLLARFCRGATYSFGLSKQAIQAAAGQDMEAHLDLERDLQVLASHSDDFWEGARAFNEKRPPRFSGVGLKRK